MEADKAGLQVVANLYKEFGIPADSFLEGGPNIVPAGLLGVEVEVPWRAYFPKLWERYFASGKKFSDFTNEERGSLNRECSLLEIDLLPRLEKTVICGIPRGADRYWEFAPQPACDARILAEQFLILTHAGLCPLGPFSLHVTIGGIGVTAASYSALLYLELIYSSQNRIASGLQLPSAWARKGEAGIYRREPYELIADKKAVEIRTLQLPSSPHRLLALLSDVADMSRLVAEAEVGIVNPRWQTLQDRLRTLLKEYDLPYTNWGNPRSEVALWQRYIENFPSMQLELLTDPRYQ